VLAVGDGLVAFAGSDSSARFGPTVDFYGELVVLRHDYAPAATATAASSDDAGAEPPSSESGTETTGVLYSLYGHLSETTVRTGQLVKAGEQIGLVGATGIAMGPHLHLEFRTTDRDYASTLNPALFLAPLPGHGTIVGRLVDARGTPVERGAVTLRRVTPDGSDWVASAVTYPRRPVNSAPGWGENFVFADLPVGEYSVGASDAPAAEFQDVVIEDGGARSVLIVR
jgi:murein DD-endopeptidase MepM/ murein hydrolase activator NlpD